jgi:beta-galactosidase
VGNVLLENTKLGPWKMIAHPLNETSWLSSIKPVGSVQVPAFYRTQFTLPENYTNTLDTYLDTSGWTKVRLLILFDFFLSFLISIQ